jgi:4-oxalocrotonate tautomerase
MPHVVVKLLSGRSEAQKLRIADAIVKTIVDTASCGEDAVSVAIEDIAPGDWDAKVFVPEIAGRAATLYRKPGYKSV